MTDVHFVVPEGIDDPARPSGGNAYDRHVCRGLAAAGWTVREHAGAAAVRQLPDDAIALVDGLVAASAPDVLVQQASRLRVVVLVHMPLGGRREQDVLEAATAVITTSRWGRRRLVEQHALPADRVHVATPGVEAAAVATASATGGALLCVGAVTPLKGHDVLLDALDAVADLSWRCECVGSLDIDPAFVKALRRPDGRVTFPGPRTGAELDRSYATADLLVLPSRAETYGMVLTEALARGVPVVATDVGGVTESVGSDAGLLVAPQDAAALAGALRAWLTDAGLRQQLREAARERRASLDDWSVTTSVVADVLAGVSR